MITISRYLLYLILFASGALCTAVLFAFTPKSRIATFLVDIPRTLIVGGVFIAITHFVGDGYIGASTIISFGMGCALSLVATAAMHHKRTSKKAQACKK